MRLSFITANLLVSGSFPHKITCAIKGYFKVGLNGYSLFGFQDKINGDMVDSMFWNLHGINPSLWDTCVFNPNGEIIPFLINLLDCHTKSFKILPQQPQVYCCCYSYPTSYHGTVRRRASSSVGCIANGAHFLDENM